MHAPHPRPYRILLVEDDPADAALVNRAVRQGPVPCQLDHVCDGVEALAYLRRHGDRFAAAPRPDLVLLDLNMPRRDGREVLGDIKTDPDLSAIPVVVLTTSDARRDIDACYRHGANSYVTKPMDVDDFFGLVHAIQAYWFSAVTLPN